jgi:hypothetical protein
VSTARTLRRIAEGLERLRNITASQLEQGSVDLEQLVSEYVTLRRSMARDFRALAHEELHLASASLDALRKQISQRMRELYGGRIPDAYLDVKGYSGVHPILFEYLSRHAGKPVQASRLRVLTGDQVHTERRLRELRDLGLTLSSNKVADDDQYVLGSGPPDLDYAARFQAEHNIRSDRGLSGAKKESLLALLDAISPVGQPPQ